VRCCLDVACWPEANPPFPGNIDRRVSLTYTCPPPPGLLNSPPPEGLTLPRLHQFGVVFSFRFFLSCLLLYFRKLFFPDKGCDSASFSVTLFLLTLDQNRQPDPALSLLRSSMYPSSSYLLTNAPKKEAHSFIPC